MAGETVKSEAICLSLRPWSRTSHVVSWLLPTGPLMTVVKGAVRSKSAFLGQYDLNYRCEILYYARSRGGLHALRECVPLVRHDELREDFRKLVVLDYFRSLVERLAPQGPDCRAWFDLLEGELTTFDTPLDQMKLVSRLVNFELRILDLLGLTPEISDGPQGCLLRGERAMPVSREVAAYLRDPLGDEKNLQFALDAARVIGVFYQFHMDLPSDVRRTVLRIVVKTKQESRV